MSRYDTITNPHQGQYKKVLCVCSVGCLRSPTAAWVLSNEPFNYNTRACGIERNNAIIVVDTVLLYWANEIIVFDYVVQSKIYNKLAKEDITEKTLINLDIPDDYDYRDPVLCQLIYDRYLNA